MMISRAMRSIHRAQGGFTLIEVLVVMTILGILAAIVSISLLGVTGSARAKGAATELVTVQSAMDEMLADQQVAASTGSPPAGPLATACPAGKAPIKDMTGFPLGTTYGGPGSGTVTALATHYLRQATTLHAYTCDANGKVSQTP